MDESPVPPLPTFGDALEKYNPDPPPPPSSKPVTRPPTTKWKQLPFPGRGGAQTSPSNKPPILPPSPSPSPSPSPIKKSRKAPPTSPKKKRFRPSTTTTTTTTRTSASSSNSRYAPPSKYASLTNLLTDSISPDLLTLFIGLNPGLQTATSGHAYAHPSNLFWKLLHRSGCTPRLCRPAEDADMPRLYNLGLTNIVTRPTRDGAELSKSEMDAGVEELERKIARYRPEAVAVVGKSIWESIWRVRYGRGIRKEEFRYGWQGEGERMGRGRGRGRGRGGGLFGGSGEGTRGGAADDGENEGGDNKNKWVGARVFVATTTSGLAASMSLREKEEIWRMLGSWVEQRRGERMQEEGAAAIALKEGELGLESELRPETIEADDVSISPTNENVEENL